MWWLIAFIEDNRWFSILFFSIGAGSLSTVLSSFLLYNFIGPEFDYLSPTIGAIITVSTFVALYYYTENDANQQEEMKEQERLRHLQNLDMTKCVSCNTELNEDSNFCTQCGFDNTKIRKKLKK